MKEDGASPEATLDAEGGLPKPAAMSRVTLAIITDPSQANAFGTLHGGVLLRLADECGAVAALRHAGHGQITTAAIDSMSFLSPVHVGERVELEAEVTYVGRTSIEARIIISAESLIGDHRRKVAEGYGLYVSLDDSGASPRPVPPLAIDSEADRKRDLAARARQAVRLARRAEARSG